MADVRILVIGAEPPSREALVRQLEYLGYSLVTAPPSAWQGAAKKTGFDLAIFDVCAPYSWDALLTAHDLRAAHDLPIVLIIPDGSPESLALIEHLNPTTHLQAPWHADTLRMAVEWALDRHRLQHITGRQETEPEGPISGQCPECLRKSAEWLRLLFDGSIDPVVITGADSRLVDVNEAASGLTGYDRSELLSMTIPQLHAVEDLHVYHTFFDRIVAGETVTTEARILRKDGTKVDTELKNRRIVIHGTPYVHTVARDITERKRAEAELRQSRYFAEQITNSVPLIIYVYDLEKERIEFVNSQVERILGYRPEDIIGMGDRVRSQLVLHEDRVSPSQLREIYADVADGETIEREFRMKRADGEWRWFRSTGLVFERGPDGAPRKVLRTAQDFTRRKHDETVIHRREGILQAIAEAAEIFLLTSSWQEGIGRVLEQLGRAAGVDSAYVFENHPGLGGTLLTSQRYLWRPSGPLPAEWAERYHNLPWLPEFDQWRKRLEAGEALYGRIRDLPDDQQELWIFLGVSAVAIVPIFVQDQWWGFMGFNVWESDREWSKGEVGALRAAALALGAAIHHKRAEEAIRESEELLRNVIDNTPCCIFVKDQHGRYLLANRAMGDLYAIRAEDMVGKTDIEIAQSLGFDTQEAEQFMAHDAEVHEEQKTTFIPEEPFTPPTGDTQWFQTIKVPLTLRQDPRCLLGVAMDITERKTAQEALEASHQALRDLSTRLAEVEEEERRRLARELHDQVGQALTALGITLSYMRTKLPENVPESFTDRLLDAVAQVEHIAESIRALMSELRPPVLDDYGLPAALRWYGEQFAQRIGIAVDVSTEDFDQRPTTVVENALFRIAQEALTNVAKHAKATHVQIALQPTPRQLIMTITDDGVGFDPTSTAPSEDGSGWGLMTMQERAAAVDGDVRIESSPGKGTCVIAEIGRDGHANPRIPG